MKTIPVIDLGGDLGSGEPRHQPVLAGRHLMQKYQRTVRTG